MIITLNAFSITTKAQPGVCPPNLDFEFGDFTNWVCRTGNVILSNGVNKVVWTGTGQVNDRHTIIPAGSGNDVYGGFPQSCPNGSGFSVRLGSSQANAEAEGISYTYVIPANAPVFSIFFQYAVVLQNPNHTIEEQPRFRAKITDLTTGAQLPCVTFDFIASSSLPGFRTSPINPSVLYKDWTPVTLNLTGLAGRTIEIEFITSDCTPRAHFGYAYIDVNSNCSGAIQGTTICVGENRTILTAPFGFQSYEWYADNTFTQLLSNTQLLTLSPPPSVGTVFPVIVIPYPGFGCRDTLYATMTISQTFSDAGIDATACNYRQVQVGSPPTPDFIYAWTPANQVSDPTISNPMGWGITNTPTEFVLKTTNPWTGCSGYDTVIIFPKTVDTSIRLTGKNQYCVGDPLAGSLTASNSSVSTQWYFNNSPINGAISSSYQPTITGSYWAQVNENGCIDSTRSIPIQIHAIPQALFSPLLDTGCVTNNAFAFTNASSVSDAAPMNYTWKFSDGNSLQTQNAIKTFSNVGQYTIELVTSTNFGCKDSITGIARVFINGVPGFSWDSICVGRPVLFRNLSNQNGIPQADYNWSFNNGGPVSSLKDPLPLTYTNPGRIDVTLQMTMLGCEDDPQSVTKSVLVNKQAAGIRYPDIVVLTGNTKAISARDTIGNTYNWRPRAQLTNYASAHTQFTGTGDVQYTIEITDKHTCVTTDTVKIVVVKKIGIYMPTAFTPNRDGLNDLLIPYLVGMKSLNKFSIYNRWGNPVFTTSTMGQGWDGKYKGADQPIGVYVWMIEYTTFDNITKAEKGIVTIVR
ncbi:MAG: PKD domain-containing protein [Bacteroidetes bacterium]|nr:MAG: PKD domain-containing protein [Bacteroidota bacterium]